MLNLVWKPYVQFNYLLLKLIDSQMKMSLSLTQSNLFWWFLSTGASYINYWAEWILFFSFLQMVTDVFSLVVMWIYWHQSFERIKTVITVRDLTVCVHRMLVFCLLQIKVRKCSHLGWECSCAHSHRALLFSVVGRCRFRPQCWGGLSWAHHKLVQYVFCMTQAPRLDEAQDEGPQRWVKNE